MCDGANSLFFLTSNWIIKIYSDQYLDTSNARAYMMYISFVSIPTDLNATYRSVQPHSAILLARSKFDQWIRNGTDFESRAQIESSVAAITKIVC